MFRYFFTYADGLPGNVGFRLFGPGHIAWLAAIACSTVFISLRYKGLSLARRRKLELSICWTIFALELLQYLLPDRKGRPDARPFAAAPLRNGPFTYRY